MKRSAGSAAAIGTGDLFMLCVLLFCVSRLLTTDSRSVVGTISLSFAFYILADSLVRAAIKGWHETVAEFKEDGRL